MFALFRPVATQCLLPRRDDTILRRLRAMYRVRRQRRALAQLDPWLLDDLGLSSAAVQAELRRPLWDVPCV
ncbi:hypothetical protein CBW24_11850 [Pacificitalea manganoxidans]|uniref:YjiS-like domain-containing protein n=1 Tax=Pacificitalea manganoxidans TaxID=1411902 RepID=A0A291M146_9RHOB|nr:DUF1127 domain-containing protein [Pacificitalea manganoxidans]ATI42630.1 hypothetical protein CBW24_11850 [Pacificitalea manganoxidans]MDR6307490.1 uncharacterized protein YjiS (DUF1127 family) [Pacificitalea manganoxidans]